MADSCVVTSDSQASIDEITHLIVVEILRRRGIPVLDDGTYVQPPGLEHEVVTRLFPVVEAYSNRMIEHLGKLLGPPVVLPISFGHIMIFDGQNQYACRMPGSLRRLRIIIDTLPTTHHVITYDTVHGRQEMLTENEYHDFVIRVDHEIFLV